MDFSRDSYYREKLSKLSLENEPIRAKDFEECEFDSCIFVGCRFEKCKFINCKFTDCILSAIEPVDSRFIEVSFTKSKVIGFDGARHMYQGGVQYFNRHAGFQRHPGAHPQAGIMTTLF